MMEDSSVEDFEPFFHAPVVVDNLFPSSGFAPFYEDQSNVTTETMQDWSDNVSLSLNMEVNRNNDHPLELEQQWNGSHLYQMEINNSKNLGHEWNGNQIYPENRGIKPQDEMRIPQQWNEMNLYNHQMKNSNTLKNIGEVLQQWSGDSSFIRMKNNMFGMNEEINPMFFGSGETLESVKGGSNMSMEGNGTSQSSLLAPSSSLHNDGEDFQKRPRKKRKKDTDSLPSPSDLGNIKDVQEVLVNYDSNLFDDYIAQVTKYRLTVLTKEENNVIKDIRRRIKNRESARKCRKNRKNKLETLEDKIKELEEDTHHLEEDISSYKKENQCMTEEVKYLQNIINTNPIFSTIFQEYSNTPEEKRQEVLENSISSQSFFLLAVMFSFGILFNVDSNGNAMPYFNREFLKNRKDK